MEGRTSKNIGAIQITGRNNFVNSEPRKVIVHGGNPMEPSWLHELEAAGFQVVKGTQAMLEYDYIIKEEPKDNPITVKGNSRQEIVKGKRHSWPVSKTRKGHR
jgi:hypothetical protein